jgi:hypothetical protein
VNRRNETESIATSFDQLGVARIGEIDWSHPRLTPLSDAARLVYACLVDGLSTTARETIDSVDLVWKQRHSSSTRYLVGSTARREAFGEICLAVQELLSAGLLVLLDRTSIKGGWVMKPWHPAS